MSLPLARWSISDVDAAPFATPVQNRSDRGFVAGVSVWRQECASDTVGGDTVGGSAMTRAAAARVSEPADALLASLRTVADRPTAAGSRGRSVRRRLIWHK